MIVVLSSTVFSLKTVSVQLAQVDSAEINNPDQSQEIENPEQIIESGQFRYGENIFFCSKKTYSARIEKANPYIRVVNIETVAPSKLVVHVAKRHECFAIKLENKYAVIDEHLKVLKVLDVYQNNSTNAIEVKNFEIENKDVEAGDFLNNDNSFLTRLFVAFREWNLNYDELRQKIKNVELDYEKQGNLLVNMRSGVKIVVENSNSQISDKLNLAFSFYDTKTNRNGQPVDYTTSGTILITETETQIYGLYKPAEND